MTSLVSIRIGENLLQAMRENANRLHLTQTEYIRQSIKSMNNKIEKKERKKRLENASILIRKESMNVNAEFYEIENDPEF